MPETEVIQQAEKAVDLVERLVTLGPLAITILVLLVILAALFFGTAVVRYLTKDKEADGETIKELRMIRNETVTTRQALETTVGKMEDAAEDNYLALRTTIDSIGGAVTGLTDTMSQLAKTVNTLIQSNAEMHQKTQQANLAALTQTRLDFLEMFASERATSLAGAAFQFPPDEDCRWKIAVIRPVQGRTAHLCYQPVWNDRNVIDQVRFSGEVVKLIQYTTVVGWYAVVRQFREEEPVQGWVYRDMVEVQLLSDEEPGTAPGITYMPKEILEPTAPEEKQSDP
ncbi:MAG: hypothetical protein K8L99_33845 [Anaerolineae bacterium]|nr:hypothetical protein [Anaerolineae bacterium]